MLLEGVAGTLATVSARGIPLGIVCDVGLTPSAVLRRELERLGVLGHFVHCSFSDEVGVYEPDRAIFEHALAGLGCVDPTTAWHVGDRRRTDVAGARAMGMRAVRLTLGRDDREPSEGPTGDVVVGSYAELRALLDLG